jgi:hypothetical protein
MNIPFSPAWRELTGKNEDKRNPQLKNKGEVKILPPK